MATILQRLLSGKISTEGLVAWLKKKNDTNELHDDVEGTDKIHSEFIAYFLNFLRDQTLHLLPNSKSCNPSPVKTPISRKCRTSTERRAGSSTKRVQLFSGSPGDSDSLLISPIISPNSLDPSHHSATSRDHRNNPPRKRWGDGETPNRYKSTAADVRRSNQRLSLGEYILTSDSSGNRKQSPYTSRETSPSPTQPPGRRSVGKRRGSPLVKHSEGSERDKTSPVFSLVSLNDFPPVGLGDSCTKRDKSSVTCKTPERAEPRRIQPTPVMKNQSTLELSPFRAPVFSSMDTEIGKVTSSWKKPDAPLVDITTLCETRTKKSHEKPRRIRPTPVAKPTHGDLSPFANPTEVDSPASAIGPAGDPSQHATEEEREFVRQERIRRQQLLIKDPCWSPKSSSTTTQSSAPCVTPNKAVLTRVPSSTEYIQADPKLVTHVDELEVMADLYSRALLEHLFPNLTVELYFLTQLLTSVGEHCKKENSDITQNPDNLQYFQSVHNAVYFAVKVMERQLSILRRLDKSTLRFLSDNTRITEFSPSLQHQLKEAYDQADKEKSVFTCPRSPVGGVSFQAETDNRKNFPQDKYFHQFKKQRDVFYEVIRDWEDNHQNGCWLLADVHGERIRWLVTYRTDLTNHLHFSRLFLSQLIMMCKGDKSFKSNGDDETVTLLAQLKKTNPEKFKK